MHTKNVPCKASQAPGSPYDREETTQGGVQVYGATGSGPLWGLASYILFMMERTTLVKSVLSFIPIYLLANTTMPKSNFKGLK